MRKLDRTRCERTLSSLAPHLQPRPPAPSEGKEEALPRVSTSTPSAATARLAHHATVLGERDLGRHVLPNQLMHSRVEPSTSVKRNVTVPEGRSDRIGVMMRDVDGHVPSDERDPPCQSRAAAEDRCDGGPS